MRKEQAHRKIEDKINAFASVNEFQIGKQQFEVNWVLFLWLSNGFLKGCYKNI